MKTISKIIGLLFFVLLSNGSQAQCGRIDLLQMDPINPTINDSITFYLYLTFWSGPCNKLSQSLIFNYPEINNTSTYCVDNLQYECNNVDIIKLPYLPVGSYTFHYTLIGLHGYVNPCTDQCLIDSTNFSFSVSDPLNIEENIAQKRLFNLFSTSGSINTIKFKLIELCPNSKLIVSNILGLEVYKQELTTIESQITLNLSEGIYLLTIHCDNKYQTQKIVIKNNH